MKRWLDFELYDAFDCWYLELKTDLRMLKFGITQNYEEWKGIRRKLKQ
jgi:hypothetical protein